MCTDRQTDNTYTQTLVRITFPFVLLVCLETFFFFLKVITITTTTLNEAVLNGEINSKYIYNKERHLFLFILSFQLLTYLCLPCFAWRHVSTVYAALWWPVSVHKPPPPLCDQQPALVISYTD